MNSRANSTDTEATMNWREAIKECVVNGETINVERLADELYRTLYADLYYRHAREEARGEKPNWGVMNVPSPKKLSEEARDEWRNMVWFVLLKLDMIEHPPDYKFQGQRYD